MFWVIIFIRVQRASIGETIHTEIFFLNMSVTCDRYKNKMVVTAIK